MSTSNLREGQHVEATIRGVIAHVSSSGSASIRYQSTVSSTCITSSLPASDIRVIAPDVKPGDVWEADGMRFLAARQAGTRTCFMFSSTGYHGDIVELFLLKYPNATRVLEGHA